MLSASTATRPHYAQEEAMASVDPVKMLKDDHNKVKQLFQEFESADGRSKKRIAKEAVNELEVHARLEEEIFYPAFQQHVKEEMIAAEAEEEHHAAKLLMDELKQMLDGSVDVHFDAKFMVLAENVKHHIQEEEKEMLPKAQKLDRSVLEELGERMMTRREELMQEMGISSSR